MKSLVVYLSQTGNTRKLAEAVFEMLPGDKALYPVDEAPDPSGYGFIAVGFWLMGGKPDPKASEYLGKIGEKPLFPFCNPCCRGRLGSCHPWYGVGKIPGP